MTLRTLLRTGLALALLLGGALRADPKAPMGACFYGFGRGDTARLAPFLDRLQGEGFTLVTFTPTYELVTLGTFLVGLGWAGANVAATATIADHCDTNHRGRAIGVNDSFGAGVSVLAALVTGPLIDWFDLPAAGICAVVVAIPPLLMLAAAWAAGKTSDAPTTAKAG